ncbi:hypothetical protein [uncultured Arcticibacterium sp.]|uniref:hypothetical protein n=1 Tax=uncultured Arcticibacterium sp. TaxID=2173042 RepID=UPI0030F4E090
MSLLKFGQYFGDVPDLTIGAEFGLDGLDGFEEQSLWHYKKGDRLSFIINPNELEHIFEHKIVQVEILNDTGTNDYADTKINSIDTVGVFFNNKPITYENDFLELVDHYSFIWGKTLESKNRHPHIDYKKYEMDFLCKSELNSVNLNGHYAAVREINDNTRIYAELLTDKKTIRVITVGGSVPDTCFLYDINDIEKYEKVFLDKTSNSTWSDEKNWWAQVTK